MEDEKVLLDKADMMLDILLEEMSDLDKVSDYTRSRMEMLVLIAQDYICKAK